MKQGCCAHNGIYTSCQPTSRAFTKLAFKQKEKNKNKKEVSNAPKHIYFSLLDNLRFKSYIILIFPTALLNIFFNRWFAD